MARRLFTAFVPAALVGLVSAALFGGFLTHCRIEWLQMVAREIQAACRDAGTQWMVVVCLLSYLVMFLILQRRLPERGPDGANVKHSTPHPGPLRELERRSPDRLDSNPDPQPAGPEIGAPRGSGVQGANLRSEDSLPIGWGEGQGVGNFEPVAFLACRVRTLAAGTGDGVSLSRRPPLGRCLG